MGSSPKQQDYKPSEAEKTSASVSMAEYQYFKQKYDPLLQQMRDKSLTEDVQSGLRGRANADTMQALSGPNYRQANSSTAAGDLAQAVTGQLGVANRTAKQVQNQMQTNVLGTARGQAADAQTGMAQASRLATSEALTRAKANQQVADAKYAAIGQTVGTFIGQGLDNMSTSGVDEKGNPIKGSFFKPVARTGEKDGLGRPISAPVSGLGNRFNYSQLFGDAFRRGG
jgi:hypothetical protein